MATTAHLVPDRVAEKAFEHLPRPAVAVLQRLRRDDLLMLAAGLAFYALVSVVPFTMLVLWIVSEVAGDDQVRQASDTLTRVLPAHLDAGPAIDRVASIGSNLGIGALLALLWPASSYGAGLSRSFDRLCTTHDQPAKGLKGRILSFALVAVMPALLLAGLVAAYAGTAVAGSGPVWTVVGWVLALVFGFAGAATASALIYKLFSPRPMGLRGMLGGGAAAGACIAVLSAGYVLFLRIGTDFDNRYATSGMAAVVLLALWLFLANALILVGYQVAEAMNRRAGGASPLRRRRSIWRRLRKSLPGGVS